MKSLAFIFALLGFSLIFGACVTVNMSEKMEIKKAPEYQGVDPRLQKYKDEYFALSKRHNITFQGKVTMGIKKINHGDVIGLCTFGEGGWREIDLDVQFLKENGEKRKKILAFHELTHCYCDRDHDYRGKPYDKGVSEIINNNFRRIGQKVPWCIDKNVPGFLSDGCPASIMYPYILEQSCIDAHYNEYINEMFEGCKPF